MQGRRSSAVMRRIGGRVAAALIALALVPILVVALVRGGARYFYCPVMDRVVSASCCAAAHARDAANARTLDADDCCQARRLGELPAGATVAAPAPDVPSAPLVALALPPPSPRDARDDAWTRAPFDAPPTGPPGPTAARARTMVFLN